jgi:hypothetical protein
LGKGSDGGTSCDKRGWTQAQHKRCQWGSDGNMTMLCIKSGVPVGTVFLDSPEGPSSATAAFYCYFPEIEGDDEEIRVVCDTPCKHATFAANRLGRFFHRWKFICDRFHLMPHKCKVCLFSNSNHIDIRNNFTESNSIARQLIYNPDEFSYFDALNLSLVEQWHAIIDHLSASIQRMTLEHAMFFLVILMRDRYDQQAAKFGVDLKSATCAWPEDEDDTDDEMYVDEAALHEEVLTGDEESDNISTGSSQNEDDDSNEESSDNSGDEEDNISSSDEDTETD